MKKRILTGIKPTGHIHLGNYIGAIKPALELAKNTEYETAYFVADYHALTKTHQPHEFRQLSYGVAATWLALGLDPAKAIFYRQSDVPEIFELNWILSCFSPKGLMNRAHAYKAQVESNSKSEKDTDFGVNMGLFNYPILMAADILMFKTEVVPVGAIKSSTSKLQETSRKALTIIMETPSYCLNIRCKKTPLFFQGWMGER